ncbi:trans-aconitate methyltransferase 1 [Dimargaris verticillata]|uniref:Trans-aconitate methyltransferase 1 n=1 Tax=Dimargaris verticillata TaxID=2761393 RepID=A0A9W8EDT5_9FUNG|nr:trans-aconitate methyltransferase 1 [Dimargaris verticillata]
MTTFSDPTFNAALYEAHRPRYLPTVVDRILQYHRAHQPLASTSVTALKPPPVAVDLATGTGQLCTLLSPHFDQVYGLDVSPTMLSAVKPMPNVTYALGSAEGPTWPSAIVPGSVDVITVAQGAHWFDRPRVWRQLHRMLRPAGTLAIIGYSFPTLKHKPRATALLWNLATRSVLRDQYWEKGRQEVNVLYGHWQLPFDDVQRLYSPPSLLKLHTDSAQTESSRSLDTSDLQAQDLARFKESQTGNGQFRAASEPFMAASMTPTQLQAYLETWSAYKRYIDDHPEDTSLIRRCVDQMLAAEGCVAWDQPWPIEFNHVLILATNPTHGHRGEGGQGVDGQNSS